MKTKIIKRIIAAVAIIFMISLNLSSQNLVNNPSFEQYTICPTGLNQFNYCTNWYNFGMSPEYFNSCSIVPGMAPPDCVFGFQYPHSGNAYAGLLTYSYPPSGPNYREFIGTQLTQQLIINQKYFLSFYVNQAYTRNVAIATNKIGCRFSTIPYDSCCPPPINNWAHLYTDSIITDSVNWIKIKGSIIADSTYQYLIIGNFFDDAHTDTLNLRPWPHEAYYYFDDVCVTTDSVYNENWTGVLYHNKEDKIQIFPNPIIDGNLNIEQIENSIMEIKLYDAIGKIAFKITIVSDDKRITIDLSSIANGYYIISIQSKNKIFNSPLIINH